MRPFFPSAKHMGFATDQWGIQKNRHSTDCATMKLLTFESWRNRRTWICMMAMDATACYDWIITYLSNLCEIRQSLPKTACMAKVKTLFNMLHKVRMAYRYCSKTNSIPPSAMVSYSKTIIISLTMLICIYRKKLDTPPRSTRMAWPLGTKEECIWNINRAYLGVGLTPPLPGGDPLTPMLIRTHCVSVI